MHLEKFADDDVLFDFDCTNLLAADEVITGSVDMSSSPTFADDPDPNPANLVFGTPIVNTFAVTYPDGRVMEIGKGFQVRISAGTPVTETVKRIYAVLGEFDTNEENRMTTKAVLWLLPPGIAS